MKKKTFKKWYKRLYNAAEIIDHDAERNCIVVKPMKKPLTGKSARRLLEHPETFGLNFQQLFKFNKSRRYGIEFNEDYDPCGNAFIFKA